MQTIRRKPGILVVALILPFLMSSCIYSNITRPLDDNLDATVLGDKVGRASYQGLLWSFAWGDAGTQAAAEEGGLTTIYHADHETLSVFFGLYFRETTILYGK